MKRRDFVAVGLATLGVSAVPMSRRAFADQHSGIAPIAIAVANSARGRIATRIYPGASNREFIVMTRVGGQDSYRSLTLPVGIRDLLRGFMDDGRMPATVENASGEAVDIDLQLTRAGDSVNFRYRLGDEEGEGGATGADEPTGGGSTQAIGFWGALVAIVAILASLAAYAIATGTPLKIKFRCNGPGCDLDIRVGDEAMEPPNGDFIADESCEGLPPLPC